MAGLGDLPGGNFSSSVAFSTSADGSVVVGISNGSTTPQAFRWDATTGMLDLKEILIDQGLDLTGWTLSFASGISADGRTIVGRGINPDGFWEAFITTLNDVEWK